jgi:hypothetical protein
VTQVVFPPAIGGSGAAFSDDADPTTGLAKGGHRTRLIPMFVQVVTVIQWMVAYIVSNVALIAGYAASAVNAPGTSATSTTSDTIATGVTSFVLAQVGKAFAIGQWVIMANTAAPGNYMIGQITAFVPGTGAMTINVPTGGAFGAGTFTAWSIALTSPIDTTLTGRVNALEVEAARQKARRRLLYKELV